MPTSLQYSRLVLVVALLLVVLAVSASLLVLRPQPDGEGSSVDPTVPVPDAGLATAPVDITAPPLVTVVPSPGASENG